MIFLIKEHIYLFPAGLTGNKNASRRPLASVSGNESEPRRLPANAIFVENDLIRKKSGKYRFSAKETLSLIPSTRSFTYQMNTNMKKIVSLDLKSIHVGENLEFLRKVCEKGDECLPTEGALEAADLPEATTTLLTEAYQKTNTATQNFDTVYKLHRRFHLRQLPKMRIWYVTRHIETVTAR